MTTTTLKIDTLKFVRRMTAAGMDERQAEALVESLGEADTSELTTKTDLAELELRIVRFMYLQAVAIIGLTVALVKLLP